MTAEPGSIPGTLRVGVAGLGNQGRNHLRVLRARDDVVVAAVADPQAAAVERALTGADAELAGFADPVEMLEAVSLDAIIVAVPTTRHFQVGMAALQRGVAVLVEKPIAATIVEAQELVRAAAETGVTLQVGHVERFNPVVRALAARLASGDLTRIHSIKTIRSGPLPERIRDVGVAIDLATHDIDIINSTSLGERPVRVAAESSRQVHTSHEDLLYGLLRFPSGIIGLIDANWLTPEKQRRIVVLGNEGMFQADYLTQSLTFVRGAAELAPEYHGGYAATFEGETVRLPVDSAEPLGLELDAFLDAVRRRAPGVVSGADGLVALSIAKLLLAAADEGRSLPVATHVGAA